MSANRTPAQIVTEAARQWLVVNDDQLPVVPLVVAVANRLPGPPVWLIMVAASSWGKSDLVMPVTGLPGVHFISKVTDKTFASGKKRESSDPRHLSLLERFKSEKTWLVAIKDLGTIQSLPPLTRNGIFGQLREIYDGQYSADYGTGVHVQWKGKLGVLAAATNVIDDYTKWSAELGERFVYFRLKRTPQALVAARAMRAVDDGVDDGRARALAAAFAEAFVVADEVVKGSGVPVAPPEETLVVRTVAELMVEARTPIKRTNDDGYEVEESEGTGRVTKVLAQIHRAAAIVYGGDWQQATAPVVRIGLDSAPRKRMATLRVLARCPQGVTVERLATELRCDANTATRHANDLVSLGFAEKDRPANRPVYRPSIKLQNYAEAISLDEYLGDDALRKLFDLPGDLTPAREREIVVA